MKRYLLIPAMVALSCSCAQTLNRKGPREHVGLDLVGHWISRDKVLLRGTNIEYVEQSIVFHQLGIYSERRKERDGTEYLDGGTYIVDVRARTIQLCSYGGVSTRTTKFALSDGKLILQPQEIRLQGYTIAFAKAESPPGAFDAPSPKKADIVQHPVVGKWVLEKIEGESPGQLAFSAEFRPDKRYRITHTLGEDTHTESGTYEINPVQRIIATEHEDGGDMIDFEFRGHYLIFHETDHTRLILKRQSK